MSAHPHTALRKEAAAFAADALHSTGNVKARPRPIPFPSRAHVEELSRTRANGDNKRWQEQVERRDMLVGAAWQEGHDRGERDGYTQGWHWGCVCGIFAGGTAIGLLWIGWGPLQRLLA